LTSIQDLKSDHKNARKRTDRSSSLIKESLEKFGAARSIVIDEENRILAGNGTIEGAKAAGIKNLRVIETDGKEIIAVKRTGLTEEDKVGLALADNRTSDLSDWDIEMLKQLSEEHDLEPWFNEDDLAELIGDTEEAQGLTDPDSVPETPEEPITKEGDLYILGKHRLLCGDSTNIQHVERLMDGKKADMVFTDPPYRMNAEGGGDNPIGRAAARLGERIKHLCEFDPELFLQALPTVFDSGRISAYIFCNKDLVPDYLQFAVQNRFAFNILFWKKPTAIPLGGQYRPDVEYLIVIRKSAIFNNSVEGVSYSKLLEHGRENSTPHPTMKPVELIENQLKIASNTDSVIVDFFGGSGSTLIAAEILKRKAHLMELDPKYCDVIVKRWENFTGNKAKHVASS